MEERKQTLAQLGDGIKLEGVVIRNSSDENTLSISIRLDKENLVKGLDFLVEMGLLEKRTPNVITTLTPSEE